MARAGGWTWGVLLAVVGGIVEPGLAADKPPNFIVFLADDLGWGELGCQGNPEIPTPHIDSLAKDGIRCTQGYVSGPYCSPTRAGLMTGRYQERFGHEFNPGGARATAGLSIKETTIAERLKSLGYATCAIGKWHLGEADEFRPTKRGFDEFFGTLANTPFFHPTLFVDSRKSNAVQPVTDPAFYTTDEYAKRAVEWIDAHHEHPFFLYLPFNAQHAPLQAPQKYLDRFPKIADEKRRTFAAMMSAMDDAVGTVLARLAHHKLAENTLVVFLADNGGPTKGTTSQNGPLRGFKAQTLEGGVRVPFLVRWTGQLPAGKVYDHPVIQLDLLPTFLTAAGGKVDPAWKLDGVDLLPYLAGKNAARPHETLYWRFGEQWAIRQGDHKLVKHPLAPQPELFDLSKDIGEQHDLSASQPGKLAELQAAYAEWNATLIEPQWGRNDGVPKAKKNRKNNNKKKTVVN